MKTIIKYCELGLKIVGYAVAAKLILTTIITVCKSLENGDLDSIKDVPKEA